MSFDFHQVFRYNFSLCQNSLKVSDHGTRLSSHREKAARWQ